MDYILEKLMASVSLPLWQGLLILLLFLIVVGGVLNALARLDNRQKMRTAKTDRKKRKQADARNNIGNRVYKKVFAEAEHLHPRIKVAKYVPQKDDLENSYRIAVGLEDKKAFRECCFGTCRGHPIISVTIPRNLETPIELRYEANPNRLPSAPVSFGRNRDEVQSLIGFVVEEIGRQAVLLKSVA